jgi:hypothetical protein
MPRQKLLFLVSLFSFSMIAVAPALAGPGLPTPAVTPTATPTAIPTVAPRVASYSIANAPSVVQAGAVFTVDLILNLGGNSSIGHEVSVMFTPGLLVAVAAVELGAPPYEFNIDSGVHGIDNAAGVVESFEAAAFTAIAPGAPFVVGQITFQAGDVGGATILGFFGTGQAVLDGGNPAQPIDGVVFNIVSVNVIATPAPTPTPTASEKTTVCHKGKNSISLPANAIPPHLKHGDTLGACP